ncbi:MAG: flippase [Halobacteriota archaeon]|nr:flippase [Halobacteriota archaeon]
MSMNRLFNKETAIQSVKIVFIFQILLFSVGFVRGVLFARILGPSQYGIFSLAFMLISLITPFIILGITSSLSRYIPKYEQKGVLIDFLKKVQRFPLISSFFFSVICIIYAEQLSQLIFNSAEYSTLVIIVGISIFPTIIYQLIRSTLWGLRNFLVRSLLELSYAVLFLCFGLFFILEEPLAESLVLGNLLAYLFVVVAFSLLIRRYVFQREDQKNRLDKTNWELYKEVINFGFWMILANLALTALHYIDRWMINRYVGATDVGIYTVATGLATILFLGVQLVGNVVSVNLNYLWEQGEREKINFILNALAKFGIMTFLSGAFIILIIKEPLIGFLYGEQYLNVIGIMPYLLLMQAFMVPYWLLGSYVGLIEKTHISFFAVVTGLAVNIGLNIWLIPLYQIMGAAIATACSSFILFLVQNFFFRVYKIKIHNTILLLTAMGLIILIPNLWITAVLLLVLVYISAQTNLIFSNLERDYILKQVRNGISRGVQ